MRKHNVHCDYYHSIFLSDMGNAKKENFSLKNFSVSCNSMYRFSLVSFFLFLTFSFAALSQERKIVITPQFSDKNESTVNSIHFKEIQRPKVALVLSGGGARGMAHLGAYAQCFADADA